MAKKQDFFFIRGGRVKMTANGGYKTTADAVWLADAADPKPGATVLDAGVGAGGVALCLLDKNPSLKITGIDLSERMLEDAAENARLNGREIELIHSDIFSWKTGRLFDCVVTNPPYFSGTPRTDGAHHNVDVYEWTRACARRLRARGTFFCIVAPVVLDKAVAALHDSSCGKIELRPIATSSGVERVIISARLGVRTGASIAMPVNPNSTNQ